MRVPSISFNQLSPQQLLTSIAIAGLLAVFGTVLGNQYDSQRQVASQQRRLQEAAAEAQQSLNLPLHRITATLNRVSSSPLLGERAEWYRVGSTETPLTTSLRNLIEKERSLLSSIRILDSDGNTIAVAASDPAREREYTSRRENESSWFRALTRRYRWRLPTITPLVEVAKSPVDGVAVTLPFFRTDGALEGMIRAEGNHRFIQAAEQQLAASLARILPSSASARINNPANDISRSVGGVLPLNLMVDSVSGADASWGEFQVRIIFPRGALLAQLPLQPGFATVLAGSSSIGAMLALLLLTLGAPRHEFSEEHPEPARTIQSIAGQPLSVQASRSSTYAPNTHRGPPAPKISPVERPYHPQSQRERVTPSRAPGSLAAQVTIVRDTRPSAPRAAINPLSAPAKSRPTHTRNHPV